MIKEDREITCRGCRASATTQVLVDGATKRALWATPPAGWFIGDNLEMACSVPCAQAMHRARCTMCTIVAVRSDNQVLPPGWTLGQRGPVCGRCSR